MKRENRNKGSMGERKAEKYLLKKGYEISEKNFTTKSGEIDIIAKDREVVVFIEVKLRKNSKYGYPYEAVNYIKQKKIINVAKLYAQQKRLYDIQFRFDIIEIYLDKNYINHITNAFWA